MKKDTKGKSSIASYIILVIVLVMAVIAIFMLLNAAKEQATAKPLTTTTTTTTIEVIESERTTTTVTTTTRKLSISEEIQGTTTKVVIPEEIKVENFTASLETIINGANFDFDYSVSREYSGARFNFNCTKYDDKNLVCVEGSGLMNIGTGLYPLYTYTDPNDNILMRQYDYFITVTDKYVILIETNSFKSTGEAKIYDKNGTFITSVDRVIMAYRVGAKEYYRIHPTLNGNILYYYSCDDGIVHVTSLNLDDMTISYADTIGGAVCY